MKITLDQPLFIYEQGSAAIQKDRISPALDEALPTHRHFQVEEETSDGEIRFASVDFGAKGVNISCCGGCKVYQIRPGFDEPLFETPVSASTRTVMVDDVQMGDWFLLFTDGMCEYMFNEDLVSIMNRPDWTSEHKRDALIDYTSANNDNHSAYILHVRNIDEVAVDDTPVELETTVKDQNHEPEAVEEPSTSKFELSTKGIVLALAFVYFLAMIAGFFVGLFG